jgi:hypothetical protein
MTLSEMERIKQSCIDRLNGYPVEHNQVPKIKNQIEQLTIKIEREMEK